MTIVDLEGEEWRPVEGWNAFYAVSNMGRAKTLAGPVKYWCQSGRSGLRRREMQEKLLTPKRVNGYPTVTLAFYGKHSNRQVHHLVLEHFVGPRPDGMDVTRHLNGDPSDNRVENLAWGTQSENILDAVRHGTHSQASKTQCVKGHPLSGDNLYMNPASGARVCRTCQHNLPEGHEFGPHNRDKTECKNGHPLEGDNLYVRPGGARACRTCKGERTRQSYLRKAEAEGREIGLPPGERTHCPRNHPLSGDNLYIEPGRGARVCRTCKRDRNRSRAAQKTA